MDFKLVTDLVQSIINSVQNTGISAVRSLQAHKFPVTVLNPVKKVDVSGTVIVGNQKNVEKILKSLDKEMTSTKNVMITEKGMIRKVEVTNHPKTMEVSNLAILERDLKESNKIASALPKTIEALRKPLEDLKTVSVSNQPNDDIKDVTKAVKSLESALSKLKLDPQITVEAPKPTRLVVPPANVTVEKTEIDYKKLAEAVGDNIPVINYNKLADAIAKEIGQMVVTGGSSGGGKYAFQDSLGNRTYGLINTLRQLSVVQEDRWGVNNVYRSGNTKYSGEEDCDGNWIIRQIIDDGTDIVMTYATKKNNPAITNYEQAWDNKLDITYDIYSVAFALV